jgi:hypothetical protein
VTCGLSGQKLRPVVSGLLGIGLHQKFGIRELKKKVLKVDAEACLKLVSPDCSIPSSFRLPALRFVNARAFQLAK